MIGTDSQFKLFDTAINTQRLCMTLVEEPITMREFMLREDNDKENVRYSYRALSLSTSTRLSLVNRLRTPISVMTGTALSSAWNAAVTL